MRLSLPPVTRCPPLFFRLSAFNLPVALLLTLLQRTPVLRVATAAAERMAGAPAAQVLRSIATFAGLGAVHSLAGATTLIVNQGAKEIIRVSSDPRDPVVRNPVVGEVGTPLTPVAFAYIGNFTALYYLVKGPLPAGLTFSSPLLGGTLTAGFPVTYITGTPTAAGTFNITIQGGDNGGIGSPEPISFVISGPASTTPPVFSLNPTTQTVQAGATVTFTASASGSPTYQWRRNGSNLAGATAATLVLPSVQADVAGDYSVVATNSAGSTTSSIATLTVNLAGMGARLSNLSVRTTLAASQLLIVGVVVGDGSRNILVRAAGPALAGFGLSTAMADPRIDLYRGSTLVSSNDNWPASLASTFAGVGAFPFASGSRDAAFVENLTADYSIQAQGSGAGVVLVEAYDTGAPTAARLVNVSARNRVGTGDDILIAGFTVSGPGTKPLLFRAVGPTLAAFGVQGTLADPKLEIYTSTGVKVTENDNWAATLAPTFSAVGAFQLNAGSRDAALVATLEPGSYTAQVRGADGGTGEALIEIYEVR